MSLNLLNYRRIFNLSDLFFIVYLILFIHHLANDNDIGLWDKISYKIISNDKNYARSMLTGPVLF